MKYVRKENVKFSLILPTKYIIKRTFYHFIAPHLGGWGVEMKESQRAKTKTEVRKSIFLRVNFQIPFFFCFFVA
jgi:hypothetical protein